MDHPYYHITNINTLDTVLTYLKAAENLADIIVFFDWDDTLVNPDNDLIIEPQVTRDLFDFMLEKRVYFCIITGRFYNTACDDNKRNINDMQHNIMTTMHPSMRLLGERNTFSN